MRIAVAGATGTVGKPVVDMARDLGHDVVEIARAKGVDLITGQGLDEALTGVEAIIDCCQSPSLEGAVATPWFTAEATQLGDAARRAGVRRSILLSIVGIDRTPDFEYYVSKVVHEKVFKEHAPGACVVRATQFHDFVGSMLFWNGEPPTVWDFPSQPIDTAEVARVLIEEATSGSTEEFLEIAGPQKERTLDQARRLLKARRQGGDVLPAPDSPSMEQGSVLPGPNARLLGPTYDEWLAVGGR